MQVGVFGKPADRKLALPQRPAQKQLRSPNPPTDCRQNHDNSPEVLDITGIQPFPPVFACAAASLNAHAQRAQIRCMTPRINAIGLSDKLSTKSVDNSVDTDRYKAQAQPLTYPAKKTGGHKIAGKIELGLAH